MLWEKKTPSTKNRGYLYIRKTIYSRDKRTLKKVRKATGSSYKNRGKFSKKIDIYCGKIVEVSPKKFLLFKDFIGNKNIDYVSYKVENEFISIIDDFCEYLFYVLDIDEEKFYSKKIVYCFGDSYFSLKTIEYLKEFNINSTRKIKGEFERFYNRAFDSGIFDEDIVLLLFSKISPLELRTNLEEEIQKLKEIKSHSEKYDYLRDFISKSN